MGDPGLMLALGVFAWAGLWTAWLAGATSYKRYSGWISLMAFLILFLFWWIILPLHVRTVEKRRPGALAAVDTLQSLKRKLDKAEKDAKENRQGK